MQIHNLTHEQVEMLDKIWEFDTLEQIEEFKRSLPLKRYRQQVDNLMELIRLQMIDDDLEENSDLTIAQKMLDKFVKIS